MKADAGQTFCSFSSVGPAKVKVPRPPEKEGGRARPRPEAQVGYFSVPAFQASWRVPSGVVAGHASRVLGSWALISTVSAPLQREALLPPLFVKPVLPLCWLCSPSTVPGRVSCCDDRRLLWDRVVHRVLGMNRRWWDSPQADGERQAESHV